MNMARMFREHMVRNKIAGDARISRHVPDHVHAGDHGAAFCSSRAAQDSGCRQDFFGCGENSRGSFLSMVS